MVQLKNVYYDPLSQFGWIKIINIKQKISKMNIQEEKLRKLNIEQNVANALINGRFNIVERLLKLYPLTNIYAGSHAEHAFKFSCEKCNYYTSHKSHFNDHLTSLKHIRNNELATISNTISST